MPALGAGPAAAGSASTLEAVGPATKRAKRDDVSPAPRLRKEPDIPPSIDRRVTYTADYVSQLPEELLQRASDLLMDCWPNNRPIARTVKNLLEGKHVDLHWAFTAASGAAFSSGDRASSGLLQLRLALMWVGDVVTASCLYVNSHEQREEPQKARPQRPSRVEQARERRTEIVLFGVHPQWRHRQIGSTLLAYVTYLAQVCSRPLALSAPHPLRTALHTHLRPPRAKVHQSSKLLVMFSKEDEGVRKFWLRAFAEEELNIFGRQYCTLSTNSSEHPLALHELSLLGTRLEDTFNTLCAMTKKATPTDVTSPAEGSAVLTAEGLQTGCLLFWCPPPASSSNPNPNPNPNPNQVSAACVLILTLTLTLTLTRCLPPACSS